MHVLNTHFDSLKQVQTVVLNTALTNEACVFFRRTYFVEFDLAHSSFHE
jgi:hypothetical protein